MDRKAFFTMTCGLYVVSAETKGRRAGCVINTAVQVTSAPPQISVAVNKENATADVIAQAGAFAVTAIDVTADMHFIGDFGFHSSVSYDKFAGYDVRHTALGVPFTPEHAAAVFSCRLVSTIDVGTHWLFIGEVVDAEPLDGNEPITYDYYHKVLKGKTPPKAPSYVEEEIKEVAVMEATQEKKTYKFVCTVCGYEVEVDTPELPEDFVCPLCGVGPDQFELVEE